MKKRITLLLLVLFGAIAALQGCSTLGTFALRRTANERIEAFPSHLPWPLQKRVEIYWQENSIPFVHAETDEDCAFSIGVVHAHLRLGQMEILRRLSAGRLSESGGPFFVPQIDHFIRLVNLQKSAELEWAILEPHEKQWLENYVRGINFFLSVMPKRPAEFWFLGITPEAWTPIDALRVGRLASADATWGNFLSFLPLRSEAGWEPLWKDTVESGKHSLESFQASEPVALQTVFNHTARWGSNSIVVSGKRTKHRSALIANDPHLGIFAPNFWVLMGYQSPSYHVLGYMLPGVPAVTVGRNPHIAWGGTYMRGVSSHLFRVSEKDVTATRTERIGRRLWFDKTITIRETAHGPVLSDVPGFSDGKEMFALHWVGHNASNEFGAYLAANRATGWKEFKNAFRDYSVSGLNVTYADKEGNIGLIPAIKQPLLKDPSEFYSLIKSEKNAVISYRATHQHPFAYNPASGFLASANNLPVRTEPPLAFVSGQNDRMNRWNALAANPKHLQVSDLKAWQQDVFSQSAFEFKSYLVSQLPKEGAALNSLSEALAAWDGHYRKSDKGPVVLEIFSWQLAEALYAQRIPSEPLRKRFLGRDDWRSQLLSDLNAMNETERQDLFKKIAVTALPAIARFANWGEMHVQTIQSPLGLIPLLGGRFRYGSFPADGASTTINKAAFSPGSDKRETGFGAQSRHISDLNDPNENYFVMLGGNDGWLDNPSLTDQVELWRKGEYLKLPLTRDAVPLVFRMHKHALIPSSSGK
jgi:penicillin G amidase